MGFFSFLRRTSPEGYNGLHHWDGWSRSTFIPINIFNSHTETIGAALMNQENGTAFQSIEIPGTFFQMPANVFLQLQSSIRDERT
jgi:hypothetical protein